MSFVVSTQQEVADYFGVKVETIRKDWRNQGMPGQAGDYDLSAITRWKFARLRDAAQNVQTTDLEEQKLIEEIRYKRLKNDHTEGLLIRLDKTLQSISILLARIRDRLQAVPDEVEMELPAEVRLETKARIQEIIGLILKEMSEWQIE